MNLSIEPTAYLSNEVTYLSSEESFMVTPFHTSIKVNFDDEFTDEFDDEIEQEEEKEVGYIYSNTFNLDYPKNDLAILADAQSSDLCYAASFFFHEEGKEHLSFRYLFYINEVFIKPEYRGHGYGIKALAMFLQNFAWGETVCCHPHPIKDMSEKYLKEKGELLMKKYWSKVGLDRYSDKRNILWTDEWSMPDWLREKIFTD